MSHQRPISKAIDHSLGFTATPGIRESTGDREARAYAILQRRNDLERIPGTSRDAALIMRRAHDRWFMTALRSRLDDGLRSGWHDRFVARAVLLITRWGEGL